MLKLWEEMFNFGIFYKQCLQSMIFSFGYLMNVFIENCAFYVITYICDNEKSVDLVYWYRLPSCIQVHVLFGVYIPKVISTFAIFAVMFSLNQEHHPVCITQERANWGWNPDLFQGYSTSIACAYFCRLFSVLNYSKMVLDLSFHIHICLSHVLSKSYPKMATWLCFGG